LYVPNLKAGKITILFDLLFSIMGNFERMSPCCLVDTSALEEDEESEDDEKSARGRFRSERDGKTIPLSSRRYLQNL